jgi:peroxiredoxin
MKRKIVGSFLMLLIGSFISLNATGGSQTPVEGERLPDFTLSVPQKLEHRSYLGLPDTKKFKIHQIKTEVVVIEIYSMYCPHCQREAPALNELYHYIENSEKLRGRIKMIGIGAGNSEYEVNFFQKRYNVPFPLFPDGDFNIHKLLGEVRTPYFFGLKIQPDGSHRIFFSQLGGAQDARQLLDELIRQAELN